jgi:hypothetical protein
MRPPADDITRVLQAVAHQHLAPAVQQYLVDRRPKARGRGDELITRIAASTHLHPSVANRLLAGPDLRVRTPAALVADDIDLVAGHASGSHPNGSPRPVGTTVRALMNPVCPTAQLEDALAGPEPRYTAGAAINPRSPLAARKAALTPERVRLITHVGGSTGDGNVRAAALVRTNPWMADTPGAWDPRTQRALLQLPDLPAEAFEELRPIIKRTPSEWSHPSLTGIDVTSASIAELQAMGFQVADWELVNRPEATARQLSEWLENRQAIRKSVEWSIVAACVARYGPAVATGSMSDTRMSAAAWLVPAAEDAGLFTLDDDAAASRAAAALGPDLPAWETYMTLAGDWHQGADDLLAAAIALAPPTQAAPAPQPPAPVLVAAPAPARRVSVPARGPGPSQERG